MFGGEGCEECEGSEGCEEGCESVGVRSVR